MKIIFVMAALFFVFIDPVFAEEITPATNLAGIKKVHDRITINLNLQGAEDFHIDPERIKTAIRT